MKQIILERYKQLVQDRIDVFQDRIAALTEDSKNDAKGSAGDKHETALSMMHLEQEKMNHKLAEIFQQKSVLDQIDGCTIHKVIGVGSLVQTNHLLVFISAALPKIEVGGQAVFAVSPFSPLGSQLIGKRLGEQLKVNNTNYVIETIA
jgi:hypothetical protein